MKKGDQSGGYGARAGAKVSFVGDMALKAYQEAGVTAELTVLDGVATGAAFMLNDQTGENATVVYRSARGTLSVDVETSGARNENPLWTLVIIATGASCK